MTGNGQQGGLYTPSQNLQQNILPHVTWSKNVGISDSTSRSKVNESGLQHHEQINYSREKMQDIIQPKQAVSLLRQEYIDKFKETHQLQNQNNVNTTGSASNFQGNEGCSQLLLKTSMNPKNGNLQIERDPLLSHRFEAEKPLKQNMDKGNDTSITSEHELDGDDSYEDQNVSNSRDLLVLRHSLLGTNTIQKQDVALQTTPVSKHLLKEPSPTGIQYILHRTPVKNYFIPINNGQSSEEGEVTPSPTLQVGTYIDNTIILMSHQKLAVFACSSYNYLK